MAENAESVIEFWQNAGGKKWFSKDDAFDAEIKSRFSGLYEKAAAGELDPWVSEPESCLALILILDQFSRNLFRNDPKAFAQDPKCREIARIAVEQKFAEKVPENLAFFVYMPFMHSEDIEDQQLSVTLQKSAPGPDNVKFAEEHRDIIQQFGRFPHRNEVLGRQSTAEEIAYLKDGGFKG